jgi:hypothetical protein
VGILKEDFNFLLESDVSWRENVVVCLDFIAFAKKVGLLWTQTRGGEGKGERKPQGCQQTSKLELPANERLMQRERKREVLWQGLSFYQNFQLFCKISFYVCVPLSLMLSFFLDRYI